VAVAAGVFIVIVAVISLMRLRRGGAGPAVNWVPRPLRPSLDRRYAKRGWEVPFDEDGNHHQSRTPDLGGGRDRFGEIVGPSGRGAQPGWAVVKVT
jgi:hypothetical protein